MTETVPKFRLRYRLSLEDFVALNDARNRLGSFSYYLWPVRQGVWYAMILFVFWVVGGFQEDWRSYLTWEKGWWIPLALALPWVIDLIYALVLRRLFKADEATRGETLVDLGRKGIDWTEGRTVRQFGWPDISSLAFRQDRIILFPDKRQVLVLPRGGLVQGDWDKLVAYVEKKVSAPRL